MAQEGSRTTSKKRIYNPDDNLQFVDIPVIDLISFLDPFDRYQETQHAYSNNDDTGARTVHEVTVTSTTTPPDHVKVERIDVLKVIDPLDRYQETQFSIDNVTGEDSTPPHFTSHLKTHVKRIHGVGVNKACYIDVERIDKLQVIDASDRYQESIYELGPWLDEQE
jgi:hypothetical protein